MELNTFNSLTPQEKIDFFMDTLSITNKTPDYFVNWEKVYRNTRKYELHLTTMNYLIGKENIIQEATKLFTEQPRLLEAIPSLLASRDSDSDFLVMEDTDLIPMNLNFSLIDETRIDEYVKYMEDTGLLKFIQQYAKMSLVDYVYGVEAGLDSNARKNRSGSTMENIVENFIEETSEVVNIEYISQASAIAIKKKWNKDVPVDKSNRRFDFAIYNKDTDKLFLLETNYYNGPGSKLKAVAGEFSTLNTLISTAEEDITFIWITDGQGWKTTYYPLLEAFHSIEYILNLKLLSDDFLEEIFR
jgi:type II restriction enzyme